VALSAAPDWLLDRLTTKRPSSSTEVTNTEPAASDVWSQLTRQPISEYQDMAAARIAGHLFRHSCDYSLVLGLLHAWNSVWCKPPLGYDEIKKIVDRIADRETARIEAGLAR
jgi:hypothetical protein